MAIEYASAIVILADDVDRAIAKARENGLSPGDIAAELQGAVDGLNSEGED